jgi:predicted NACHT family NTPase
VQEVRQKIQPYIQERCGTMGVLDLTQPIALGEIYTSVNILEKITGRRWLEHSELMLDVSPKTFERYCLGDIRERRIGGLEAVEKFPKLMILGKPGAGKTTFLKHLAVGCIGGGFLGERVPVFITLKEFAEANSASGSNVGASGKPDLLEFIERWVFHYLVEIPPTPLLKGGNEENSVPPFSRGVRGDLLQILNAGRALILLDGLDEVKETDSSRVLRQIKEFSQQFPLNQFIITCRIAAKEYTFEKFTEVEVADFNDKQIADFSDKWFRSKNDPIKAERFLQRLKEDAPIRELATSPLLLTLLCLVFEDTGSFPTNRARLYGQGIEKLLRKWNPREREGDRIYKKLSPDYREELLIQIAWKTFKHGNYFFNQIETAQQIRQYIQSLPGILPEDLLQLDSKAVLESIEAQHGLLVERARGIYSFSHLTFHEYFTARKIVTSCNPYGVDDPTLQMLVSHVAEKRWREVFLLTVGMLESADVLLRLIKVQIDGLLAGDEHLHQFINWVEQKTEPIKSLYKTAAIRSIYWVSGNACMKSQHRFLDEFIVVDRLNLTTSIDSTFEIDGEFYLDENFEIDCDLALSILVELALLFTESPDNAADSPINNVSLEETNLTTAQIKEFGGAVLIIVAKLIDNLNYFLDLKVDTVLKRKIKQLKKQLPILEVKNDSDVKELMQWMKIKGSEWTEQLQTIMIEHRNIGHDWQFSDEQKQLLQQYYDANKLLVDCLNSDCYVSREVRQEIEETLLLSMLEIENRNRVQIISEHYNKWDR